MEATDDNNREERRTMTNNEHKNIVFKAPLLSMSGYGVHARQIAKWLLGVEKSTPNVTVYFQLLRWGDTAWHVDHDAENGLVREILQHCNATPETKFDVSFQLQLPNEWDPFMADKNVGITAGVETDKCNPAWIDCINRMDLVIVPSEFSKSTFVNTGELRTPVEVVPESWIEECRDLNAIPGLDLDLNTDFNFLVVSQFTGNNPENDRKNIAYTLKWAMEEFKDDPSVGIILKTNFGRQTSIDKQNCINTVSRLIMECRKGDGPQIHLLHGHMTNEEIVGLYKHPKVNALLSLTRAEGFGLPLLEAATCGLPVIATGWSAHTEFLGKGKYVKVDYDLVDVHQSRLDGQIFMPGVKWSNPIESDAKRKMSRFRKAPAIPKTWAKELREKLLVSHSPENVQKLYNEVMEKHSVFSSEMKS